MSSNDDGAWPRRSTSSSRSLEAIELALDELAADQDGLSFIYSALDLLAQRFRLRDVIIVLANESVGTQIFRLAGLSVSSEMAAEVESTPGVYCQPAIVAGDILGRVHDACQVALHSQQQRFAAARQQASAASAIPTAAPVPPPEPVRRTATVLQPVPTRLFLSRVLLLVDVVTLALTVTTVHGPVRFLFGLVLGLVIPGWSVVGLFRFRNAALEFGLTLAASLSLVMLASQIMASIDLWHPVVLEELTCVLCSAPLYWQSRGASARARHSRRWRP